MYQIYLITNLVNQKKYVGQTCQSLNKRWRQHIFCARKSVNKPLYNAMNKYGVHNFTIELLETNLTESTVDERESYYINKYNTFIEGYNLTTGGQGIHSFRFSEQTRLKLSESHKKYWVNLKETDVEEYNRLCEIRRVNSTGKQRTQEVKTKLSKIAKQRVGEKNPFYGKHFSEESKQKLKDSLRENSRKIKMFDLTTGKEIKVFSSLAEIVEELHLANSAHSRIGTVCKNRKGHAYQYIWRYADEYPDTILSEDELQLEHKNPRAKAINKLTINNKIICEYNSAATASKTLSDDYNQQRLIARKINYACYNKDTIVCGYKWEFVLNKE